MSRHFLIGLAENPWHRIARQLWPGATWQSARRLADWTPGRGDHAAGFFTLAETALMQRFGVQVMTFGSDGTVMPNAARALREPHGLQLVTVPPVLSGSACQPLFEAGPQALCRAVADRARRQRAATNGSSAAFRGSRGRPASAAASPLWPRAERGPSDSAGSLSPVAERWTLTVPSGLDPDRTSRSVPRVQ